METDVKAHRSPPASIPIADPIDDNEPDFSRLQRSGVPRKESVSGDLAEDGDDENGSSRNSAAKWTDGGAYHAADVADADSPFEGRRGPDAVGAKRTVRPPQTRSLGRAGGARAASGTPPMRKSPGHSPSGSVHGLPAAQKEKIDSILQKLNDDSPPTAVQAMAPVGDKAGGVKKPAGMLSNMFGKLVGRNGSGGVPAPRPADSAEVGALLQSAEEGGRPSGEQQPEGSAPEAGENGNAKSGAKQNMAAEADRLAAKMEAGWGGGRHSRSSSREETDALIGSSGQSPPQQRSPPRTRPPRRSHSSASSSQRDLTKSAQNAAVQTFALNDAPLTVAVKPPKPLRSPAEAVEDAASDAAGDVGAGAGTGRTEEMEYAASVLAAAMEAFSGKAGKGSSTTAVGALPEAPSAEAAEKAADSLRLLAAQVAGQGGQEGQRESEFFVTLAEKLEGEAAAGAGAGEHDSDSMGWEEMKAVMAAKARSGSSTGSARAAKDGAAAGGTSDVAAESLLGPTDAASVVRHGSLSGSHHIAKAALEMLGLGEGLGEISGGEAAGAVAAPGPLANSSALKSSKKVAAGGSKEAPPLGKAPKAAAKAAEPPVPAKLEVPEGPRVLTATPAAEATTPGGRPAAAGFRSETAVKILPLPPTKLTDSRTPKVSFSADPPAVSAPPVNHGTGGDSSPSWWDTSRVMVASYQSSVPAVQLPSLSSLRLPSLPRMSAPKAPKFLEHLSVNNIWGLGSNKVAPGELETLKGEGPKHGAAKPGKGFDGEEPPPGPWGFVSSLPNWACDLRWLVFLAALGACFVLMAVFLFSSGTHKEVVTSLPVNASMVQAPPSPELAVTPRTHPPGTSGIPVCEGVCCSANAPLLPSGMVSMPSQWWSNQMADGAQVQIRSESNNKWWAANPVTNSWAQLGSYELVPPVTQFLTVKRVSASTLQLLTPEGFYVTAHPDGSVTADQALPSPTTIFTVLPVSNSSFQVRLQASDGKLLASHYDGSLVRTFNPVVAETLQVREVMAVPSIRGVNLGNWLVAEEWMQPPLFITVPLFTDGLEFQLQSCYSGKWASPGASGVLACNVDAPGEEGTFYLRTVGDGKYQIRSSDYMYWSAENGGGGQVVANQAQPGALGYENFTLAFNPLDHLEFMIQTANGNYVTVAGDGSLSATVANTSVDPTRQGGPGWIGRTVFAYNETTAIRGEWQLSNSLGAAATAQINEHRQTWVTEADFAWLAEQNINALRVPIGYWLAEGVNPTAPFTAGAVLFLDQAFNFGEKYGISIFLSMHGAPGSQNGLEHSASRDGVPDWASQPANVAKTLAAVEYVVARYADSPAFLGIGLLNEPLAEAVPLNVLQQYYLEGYHIVRNHSECAYVAIQPRVGGEEFELDTFMSNTAYTNTIVEEHFYHFYRDAFQSMAMDEMIEFVQVNRSAEVSRIEGDGRLTLVGEWSLALPEALNATAADYAAFGEAQLAVYSQATAGWFFWSYKLGRTDWPDWSFSQSYANGWLKQKAGGGWL